jgi:anti-anti-sigma regulatory factor
MTAMTALETRPVTSTRLADGLLVQLAGELGQEQLPDLRATLLSPLPDGCHDVVIDAGNVTDIDIDAIAIVFAAWAWTEDHGARFLLSRTSEQFEAALADNGVADDLPRLGQLHGAPGAPSVPGAPVIPLPRAAVS